MSGIAAALERHAAERPQALAAADADGAWTWHRLADRVARVAADLASAGVRRGHRVALRLPDGVEALAHLLAVLRLEAVHAPLDVSLAQAEVDAAIPQLGATWRIEAGVDGRPRLQATGIAPVAEPLAGEVSAFLRLTSGTTGTAKGVLLSQRSLAERIAAANRALNLNADDRVLWLLPMAYHVAVSVLLYIEVGAAIVFGNRLRAVDTARCAVDYACTFAYAAPWHVRRLADLPAGSLPSSLRRVVSTTTALDAEVAARFHARHGIPVFQALGIIECGLPLLSAGDPGEPVGRFALNADYRARLRGVDDQGVGELCLAGPGFLDAYLDPWRTRAEVLDAEGFFATGDLARIEGDGAIQLLGRCKDVINVGGIKVFPQEVESVLEAHPAVVRARVFAGADPRTGEQVLAEVEAEGIEVADLQAWCAQRLAALKCPARIALVPALALTPSGKVRR